MRILLVLAALAPLSAHAFDRNTCTTTTEADGVHWTCGEVRGTVRDVDGDEALQAVTAARQRLLDEQPKLGPARVVSVNMGFMSVDEVVLLRDDGTLHTQVSSASQKRTTRTTTCEATGVAAPLPKSHPCSAPTYDILLNGIGPLAPLKLLGGRVATGGSLASLPFSGAIAPRAPDAPRPTDATPGPALAYSLSTNLPEDFKPRLRRTLEKLGSPAIDATAPETELQSIGVLPTGNLDAARVPSYWPAELKADWESAVRACRIRAGPPPYGISNKVARRCGNEAASALWQRWLVHSHVAQVLVVSVQVSKNGGETDVRVQGYGTDDTTFHQLSEVVPRGWEPALAKLEELGRRVIAGEGAFLKRTVTTELPTAPEGAAVPPEGVPVEAPPLDVPAACRGKLPALALAPAEDPITQSLVSCWKRTLGTDAPAETWTCRVELADAPLGDLDLGSVGLLSLRATLVCGERRLSGTGMGLSRYAPAMQKQLTKDVLGKVVAAACGAK